MDLNGITQLASSQGPVFWIATVAIALGATLLVVALIQILQRVWAAKLTAMRQVRIIDAAAAAPASATTAESDVYVPSQTLAAVAPPLPARTEPSADGNGDYSMALLLRRLQSAGDRLEEIAGDLRGEFSAANDSGLKEDLQDVEYVFRASGP